MIACATKRRRAAKLPKPYYRCGPQTLYCGDCLEVMAAMRPGSVDAILTDPPYGLEFMGQEWDKLLMDHRHTKYAGCRNAHGPNAYLAGPRAQEFHHQWAREALRVAKPGCHLLAFGGTRTFHRLACALEDAGWEIRDTIMWVYGSGFPKSLDVSKAIDKAAGRQRERLGRKSFAGGTRAHAKRASGGLFVRPFHDDPDWQGQFDTLAATDAAKLWQGWGTALKPAWEPIIVARKPLDGTVIQNVQEHGMGALNIDGCRIAAPPWRKQNGASGSALKTGKFMGAMGKGRPTQQFALTQCSLGRFPANLIHDGSEEVVAGFPQSTSDNRPRPSPAVRADTSDYRFNNHDRTGFHDSGSAARFFYCAKAGRSERGQGNKHPTVKPLALMRYLSKLVSQPGQAGVLLDPFAGSGTTLIAAAPWFRRVIGIEQERKYCRMAAQRLEATTKNEES